MHFTSLAAVCLPKPCSVSDLLSSSPTFLFLHAGQERFVSWGRNSYYLLPQVLLFLSILRYSMKWQWETVWVGSVSLTLSPLWVPPCWGREVITVSIGLLTSTLIFHPPLLWTQRLSFQWHFNGDHCALTFLFLTVKWSFFRVLKLWGWAVASYLLTGAS